MNNIQRFALEYDKYTNKRISEENKREYTIGWIQALMVLSAIIFPMLAIMLSPRFIKLSPLMLGMIILTTTVIGLVVWKQYESKPDFTEENLEKLDKEFSNQHSATIIKQELLEKYTNRINELQLEVLKVENKKVYYQMIERIKDYQINLMNMNVKQNKYSYYDLHKYIYFYHMFDSVKSFRQRDENYFNPSSYDD